MNDILSLPPDIRQFLLTHGINIIAALLILIIGWTLARFAGRWSKRGLGRLPHFDPTLPPLLGSTIRYAIIGFTLIAVLQRFGIQTTSIIAIVGAAGIAIGLALQNTLSNVAAGVMLLLIRPFRVGDKIRAGEAIGTVREIELFRTVIVTDDLLYLSVPNSTIFGAVITNESRENRRRLRIPIILDHASDIVKAQELILNSMSEDKRILTSPAPTATISAMDQSGIHIMVTAFTTRQDNGAVKDQLLVTLFRNIAANKTVSLARSGIQSTTPLPPDDA